MLTIRIYEGDKLIVETQDQRIAETVKSYVTKTIDARKPGK